MIRTREKLERYINDTCYDIALDQEVMNDTFKNLLDKYNIPINTSFDIVTKNVELGEYSDCILYCVLSIISPDSVNKFFTKSEIETYKDYKYVAEKIELPIIIKNMCQVNDDQWIGTISAKNIVLMRKARFINYNENTQRTKQKVVRGQKIYYKISVDKKSVNEIRELFEKGIYIPDEITLNIPMDEDFSYENGTLYFRKLKHFDILDGYHRLLALTEIFINNPDFEYTMELRITNFSEEKAQQFIYQKGQKTKMLQIDSSSYNQNSISNLIVKRLNEDSGCELYGRIMRNGGQVAAQELAVVINHYFCKRMKITDKNERIVTNKLKEEIKTKINTLMYKNNELYDNWNSKTLCCVAYAISRSDDPEIIQNEYERVKDIASEKEDSMFRKSITMDRLLGVSKIFAS